MRGHCSLRSNVLYLLAGCEEWSIGITGEQQFERAKTGTGKEVAADLQPGALFWADLQVAVVHGGLG